MIKIGILSDTHGILKEEVIEGLQGCEAIFHAGDVGSSNILDRLREIAPVYVVKGNNDPEEMQLPETLEVRIGSYTFYMIHDLKSLKTVPKGCDFIISGHSHQFDIHYKSKTRFINPGGCGKKRFSLPLTFVSLNLTETIQIQLHQIT